ncbi:MAG: VWA domain-containing protein [Christensenellaceae bacterium]|nr:VWA domain-containing protein [Christensenellaceae bacterium]
MPEHIHTDLCYPAEEVVEEESPYLCGMGLHSHAEACFDAEGSLICSVPEHEHSAACMTEGYDTEADRETASDWKDSISGAILTGIWREDLVAVAETQIGYKESVKNVILDGDMLRGYTRYGDKAGDDYMEWDAAFVAFCLSYAEIDALPYETVTAKWPEKLAEKGLFTKETDGILAGDLLFLDMDQDGKADLSAIIAAVEGGKLRLIMGDTAEGAVVYRDVSLSSEEIFGFGILPENPLSPEEMAAADEVSALLAELPLASDVRAAFTELNEIGDRPGFETLRQALADKLAVFDEKYALLHDLQKERVGKTDKAEELRALCGGIYWREYPVLEEDHAVISSLMIASEELIAKEALPEEAAALGRKLIQPGDVLQLDFTAECRSYFEDLRYGEALIRMEIVLSAKKDEAFFVDESYAWLEFAEITEETRLINGKEVDCQVLSGYKRLIAKEEGYIIPGSFTESVAVEVTEAAKTISLKISAAMEKGTWEGICEEHGIEEKLTVQSHTYSVYRSYSAEEQQAVYEAFALRLDETGESLTQEEIDALALEIDESYFSGALDKNHYAALSERLLVLSGFDLESIAEPSIGNGWAYLNFGDPHFKASAEAGYPEKEGLIIPTKKAAPQKLMRSLSLDSNSQIPSDGWGGDNSVDDVIWVSKTIEGTPQENVFDITLDVITRDEVHTVYEEPDMSVVIVMDISNTMVSKFSGEQTDTRYNAAMASAEQFLLAFAENTSGLSRVGYVAFNTHGHKIFDMQPCGTEAQAMTLANTMRVECGKVMTNAAKAAGGEYADSHDRFTNMQAGLKLARDMLADSKNRHKYIIFLSDGFPTTYVKSGYTGYDPYCTSGSNNTNGVFFDNLMGVYCNYGTSYSDTAAIKARQMAESIKSSGINIFTIGVDVAGQTIKYYHDSSVNNMKTFSVVERRKDLAYYNSTGYEIGTLHSQITKKNPTSAETAAMAQDFKDWLRDKIGSGYYFDSTDEADLSAAYEEIFEEIMIINGESAHLDWIATDPMPGLGVHEIEAIEFIAFYDKNGDLQQSLKGVSADGEQYENTASFDTKTQTIKWDLKNSGYVSTTINNKTNYRCTLKYRVRLQNEQASFDEGTIYQTNDTTSLTYRIIEVNNGVTNVSDRQEIEFPIPKVFGYVEPLQFKKVDVFGKPLAGVEFTLTHDTESCGSCRGDHETSVDVPEYKAVSGEDGIVSFDKVPSGHHYILTETEPLPVL